MGAGSLRRAVGGHGEVCGGPGHRDGAVEDGSVGGVLTLFGLWVRRSLEETAVFQEEGASEPPARRPLGQRIAESRFMEAWRRYPKQILTVICAGSAENAGFYVFGTFSVTYAEDRGGATAALLSGISIVAAVKLVTVPALGALSDRVGRRPVSIGGALVLLVSSWPFFGRARMCATSWPPLWTTRPVNSATRHGLTGRQGLVRVGTDTAGWRRIALAEHGIEPAAPFVDNEVIRACLALRTSL